VQTLNISKSKNRSGAVETLPCHSTTLGHTLVEPPTAERTKHQFTWKPSVLGGNPIAVNKYHIIYIASAILVSSSGMCITGDGFVEIVQKFVKQY